MNKMKLRKKYLAGFLAAAAVVTGVAAVPAYAARDVEVDRMCSLTVSIGEEGSYIEDLERTRWEVRLYRIASVDAKGEYTATEGFESLEDGIDGVTAAADWDTVAAGAQEIILSAEGEDAGSEADAVITMADGEGTVQDLSTGLYILLSETAETALYEYTFQPAVALLPGPEYEGNETTSQGDWIYDQTTVLKYEQEPRYGSLRVVKTLDNYNAALGPVTFVFQIEGWMSMVRQYTAMCWRRPTARREPRARWRSRSRRELMSQSQRSTAEPAMNWCPKGRRQA